LNKYHCGGIAPIKLASGSTTAVLKGRGYGNESWLKFRLLSAIFLMIKVNNRQIMGVSIWHTLVPICLDCNDALLYNNALNWYDFFLGCSGWRGRDDSAYIDFYDKL
jgi:hypothetical protein